VLFTLALRLPFLGEPLGPDEAGLLMVARHWSAEGPFLYGDYLVGRGMVVILFYALADALGGELALRLLACGVAAVMVLAAGRAGHLLRGTAGAGWAALVAAAYSSTYAFSSAGMNDRLLAAAIVMVSCAATLSAVARAGSGSALPRAAGAGALATLPVLAVQSYADGLVFAMVLLLCSVLTGALSRVEAVRVLAGGVLGLLGVLGTLAVAIAVSPFTGSQLWFQTVGYRLEASRVVGTSSDMPGERLTTLLTLTAISGVLVVVASLLLAMPWLARRRRLMPAAVAVLAMVALNLASMAAGGDYWPDYMLQTIPALAIAAALVAPAPRGRGATMRVGAGMAVLAALGAVYLNAERPLLGTSDNEAQVGRWIHENSRPGDTASVLWGKANVLHYAEMSSPYPYLWSLLTRTLDPELDELRATLAGREAPTWVVQWHGLSAWGLDDGRLEELLHRRYVLVGEPCGQAVFLLREATRPVTVPDKCPPPF
jgi:hypothetical protein